MMLATVDSTSTSTSTSFHRHHHQRKHVIDPADDENDDEPVLSRSKSSKKTFLTQSKSIENNDDYELEVIKTNRALCNYQPSISDQIKVGFYSSDRCSQTNETEIVDLKSATTTLDYLCTEMDNLKFDLNFVRTSVQNQFELELDNKSMEIYAQICEKFAKMNKEHEEALDRVRGAYRSQLANAIAQVAKFLEMNYMQSMAKAALATATSDDSVKKVDQTEELNKKIRELQKALVDQEAELNNTKLRAQEEIEKSRTEREQLENSFKEERTRFTKEMNAVNTKINRLQEALAIKEEESVHLLTEVGKAQKQLQKEQDLNKQLQKEIQDIRTKSEQEKTKLQKEFEKQKIEIEKKAQEKLKETREQLTNAAKQELSKQQQAMKQQEELLKRQMLEQQQRQQQADREQSAKRRKERESYEKMLQEQMTLSESLQKEKLEMLTKKASEPAPQQVVVVRTSTDDVASLSSTWAAATAELQNARAEIARLKRELFRNNETWEKKFEVLKNSLHAIKDEMYMRQTLQKNSANVAYASVAYTMDQPPPQSAQLVQMNTSDSSRNYFGPNNPSSNRSHEPKSSSQAKPILPSITRHNPSLSSENINEYQIVDDMEMKRLKDECFGDIDFIKLAKRN